MNKYILSFILISQCFLFGMAQNETDAIRFANLKPVGTARYTAMGGAFGALGGDLTTLSYNPAGLGIYRRNDVSFSTAWTGTATGAEYNGDHLNAKKFNISLSNIGFVAATPMKSGSDWKTVNFGFAYNQLANFNRDVNINGTNKENSKLDIETDWLNDNPNSYDRNPYYDANVVFYDTLDANTWGYFNDYNYGGSYYGAKVQNLVRSSGYAGEYDFSLAANYKDFFYLGATFGILRVDYTETSIYSETPTNNGIALKYFESTDYFRSKGNGYNFKIGFMMKLGHLFRIGGAVHTPTVFNLRDDYYTDVIGEVQFDELEYGKGQSPRGDYEWRYASPMKVMGSSAIVLGRFAVISAELELVDYGGMNMSADDYSFIEENTNITNVFSWAANAKAGAEIRTGILSWRAGMAFYQSPYKADYENSEAHVYQVSGGLGVKTAGFFFDAAYSYSIQNEKYYMYDLPNTGVDIRNTRGTFIATMGYRF